uniref:Uncharacterized protein n=1 Tax=Oryza meridionalis TaxID=40149 RepID=A0A0E0EHU7_9ORYZ
MKFKKKKEKKRTDGVVTSHFSPAGGDTRRPSSSPAERPARAEASSRAVSKRFLLVPAINISGFANGRCIM